MNEEINYSENNIIDHDENLELFQQLLDNNPTSIDEVAIRPQLDLTQRRENMDYYLDPKRWLGGRNIARAVNSRYIEKDQIVGWRPWRMNYNQGFYENREEFREAKQNARHNKQNLKKAMRYAGSDQKSAADRQFYHNLGKTMTGIVSIPALGWGIEAAGQILSNPIVQGIGALDGLRNLFTGNGVQKTYKHFKNGEYGKGALSLTGDVLDVSPLFSIPRIYKTAKLAHTLYAKPFSSHMSIKENKLFGEEALRRAYTDNFANQHFTYHPQDYVEIPEITIKGTDGNIKTIPTKGMRRVDYYSIPKTGSENLVRVNDPSDVLVRINLTGLDGYHATEMSNGMLKLKTKKNDYITDDNMVIDPGIFWGINKPFEEFSGSRALGFWLERPELTRRLVLKNTKRGDPMYNIRQKRLKEAMAHLSNEKSNPVEIYTTQGRPAIYHETGRIQNSKYGTEAITGDVPLSEIKGYRWDPSGYFSNVRYHTPEKSEYDWKNWVGNHYWDVLK